MNAVRDFGRPQERRVHDPNADGALQCAPFSNPALTPFMDYSNCTALVVDDFATMRRIVSNLLREAGFAHITEAEDGVEAMRKLENGGIQLIVSDWNMPNMTGLELLKMVRDSDRLKHLPFLLVTAEARKENIVEAAHAGADGYIVKPFSSATLSAKIEAIFTRKGLV